MTARQEFAAGLRVIADLIEMDDRIPVPCGGAMVSMDMVGAVVRAERAEQAIRDIRGALDGALFGEDGDVAMECAPLAVAQACRVLAEYGRSDIPVADHAG